MNEPAAGSFASAIYTAPPGAATGPQTASIWALDTAPSLRIRGVSPERSRTVDSPPPVGSPPSSTKISPSPRTLLTSAAVLTGGEPDMLALVPVIGDRRSAAIALGIQASGTRRAIVGFPPETESGIAVDLGQHQRKGARARTPPRAPRPCPGRERHTLAGRRAPPEAGASPYTRGAALRRRSVLPRLHRTATRPGRIRCPSGRRRRPSSGEPRRLCRLARARCHRAGRPFVGRRS